MGSIVELCTIIMCNYHLMNNHRVLILPLQLTALISSQLALHRLAVGRQSRIETAMTMLKQMLFKYQGHISAALILGGVDHVGAHLYTIYPHGSVDSLPYVTMGSGSLAAMAVFEAEYQPNL